MVEYELISDIENAQEDCVNLDWISKDQAIEIIKKNNVYESGYAEGMKIGRKDMEKFQKAYYVLMEYFDSIADEEKKDVDRRLKECGL